MKRMAERAGLPRHTRRLIRRRAAFGLVLAAAVILSAGCGSDEPAKAAAPEPVKTCAEKFGASAAWTISDQSGLAKTTCAERPNGIWACNKRGTVYDCFTCSAVKTTYDPNDSGPGSFKALGVDDAEVTLLQKNYDDGCVAQVDWDQFAPDAITRQLLCKEAMAGLKVCRNIDGERQWWTMAGAPYLRRREVATVGNSKGANYVLEMPTAQADVLDLARWPFLACESLAATKEPGWDLWLEVQGDVRTVSVNLVEPKTAAAEPGPTDLSRLADAFKTCDDSYGNWE